MVLVVLESTDRPEHSKWKCPECNNALIEIINGQYRVIADVFDPTNTNISAVGVRCGGHLRDGGHCRYWYYFSLSNPNA
jgi:hypothetical protein